MFFWSGFPFVRITLAFTVGIIASVFLAGYHEIAFGLIVLSCLFFIGTTFFRPAVFLNYNWLYGFVLVLFSFSSGYVRLFIESKASSNVPTQEILAYRGLVVSQPLKKGNYHKSIVEVTWVKDSLWKPLKYRINLYIKADSVHHQYGDIVLVQDNPFRINSPQNPEEFNYKRYLSFLTIYQQHFTDNAALKVVSSGNGSVVLATSLKLRAYFSKLLDSNITVPKEAAIAKALLLGNKNELDDDIKNTYAASGAMHVLAVSGLHVGIIYGIIYWLFLLLPKRYRKKWLIASISIPLLWGYAFITGLSPSVLRAVTLFSIIAIGNSFNRRSNMVNLLAVSAFILLVFKPYLLMQVGFQLSYVAVLGIIFIYPQIRKTWLPTGRITIFFWDVVSISIAAQIATFPLSILYFHRFPPYFLISNLLVIPAATLIVGVGIIFFTFSYFPFITQWLGWLLGIIIGAVNYVLELIYKFPGSNWDDIYLNVSQTWVLYLLISFIYLFIVYKKKYWAKLASFSMILFSFLIGNRWVNNNQLTQIISYKVTKHLALDFIQSGQLVSVMDTLLIEKPDKIHYHINPNRLLTGASEVGSVKLAMKKKLYGTALVWNGTSILILDELDLREHPFDIVFSKRKPQNVRFNKKFGQDRSLNQTGNFKVEL
ncbi:MAG: ComEC family competence protein [Cyclobacteriaceae bacterium]|nr:ComEC family competence protein [Cyclobacteriaceae bacterium]